MQQLQTFADRTARGSNQSGMRAYNERLVLSLIRRSGPTSKAEIARLTGLSAQTVSVIMRALEADGLLKKGARVRGRVGMGWRRLMVPVVTHRDRRNDDLDLRYQFV